MAYDKVVDSAALDASLTAIADAIRAKAGTSDAMTLDGMVEAIAAIQAGGGVTYGTIIPLEANGRIEHNLGTVPKMFMWYITFNNTMTGRLMDSNIRISTDEQAYDSDDIDGYSYYIHKMVFILVGDVFYSMTFPSNNSDWGFFTKGTISNLESTHIITLDENQFVSSRSGGNTSNGIVPYSKDGSITVHWFAIA